MRTGRMERTVAARVGFLLALLAHIAACDRARDARGPFDHLLGPVEGRFLQVSSYDTTGGNLDRLEIAAGDSVVLLDRRGPAVIRRIWLTVFSRDPHYLRRIALKMYWDGETDPSVSAPLGDFFGNGFEKRHYAALPMGVSSGGFYVYLPMPFRERARIVIENGTGRNIDAFYFNIDVLEVDDPGGELPTFHAWWHRDARTAGSAPHLIVDAVGRGRFVGLSLNAQSHDSRLWFLEGDEIFHVDGERRGQGTGTEDYFNSGWYFEAGEFSAPYHGLILMNAEHGRIAAYRWHVPDPIPFHDSIRVELEHGHANESVADYATMAYWYQVEPHVPLPPLAPPDARRVLSVAIPPGAVPAESLTAEMQDDGVVLSAPVPRPDRYEVLIFPVGRPDGGSRRYRVGAGDWRRLSLAAADSDVLAPLVLDTISAADRVTVQVAVSEAGAALECVTCPCVDLCPAALWPRPVRRWAVAWNIVGPFANPQQLGTEHSPAIDSVYPPELDPDPAATYIAMNGRRAGWERVEADPDGRVHLNPRFDPNDWVAAYAEAFIFSPSERRTTLLLGADDAHVLWVNGERVSERQGRHISLADDLAVPVRLRAGWNRVLLKLADLDGGWAFMLRVADPGGDLRWSARPSP